MANTNNKEMSVCETQTSLNNAEVTDVKSVPPLNYTINNDERQDSAKCENSNNAEIPEFPLKDTDNYSNDYNIIRLNGMLHAYQNNVYSNDREQIEANIYNKLKEISTDVALEDITKTIKTIQYETKDHEKVESPANFIPFNNCVLDTDTLNSKDFYPDLIVTNKLGINLDEATINSANIEVIQAVFKRIAPTPEMQQLLSKIIGASCFRSVDFPLSLLPCTIFMWLLNSISFSFKFPNAFIFKLFIFKSFTSVFIFNIEFYNLLLFLR